MKIAILIVGVICTLLGGLWLLQGLGLVNIPPLLCVGDCAPIEGGSPTWTGIGAAAFAVGVLAIVYAVRRRI